MGAGLPDALGVGIAADALSRDGRDSREDHRRDIDCAAGGESRLDQLAAIDSLRIHTVHVSTTRIHGDSPSSISRCSRNGKLSSPRIPGREWPRGTYVMIRHRECQRHCDDMMRPIAARVARAIPNDTLVRSAAGRRAP